MSQTDRQQVAADGQAIRHLRARYSHTIDREIEGWEWDEFLSLYTDDAVVDYPQSTLEELDDGLPLRRRSSHLEIRCRLDVEAPHLDFTAEDLR